MKTGPAARSPTNCVIARRVAGGRGTSCSLGALRLTRRMCVLVGPMCREARCRLGTRRRQREEADQGGLSAPHSQAAGHYRENFVQSSPRVCEPARTFGPPYALRRRSLTPAADRRSRNPCSAASAARCSLGGVVTLELPCPAFTCSVRAPGSIPSACARKEKSQKGRAVGDGRRAASNPIVRKPAGRSIAGARRRLQDARRVRRRGSTTGLRRDRSRTPGWRWSGALHSTGSPKSSFHAHRVT